MRVLGKTDGVMRRLAWWLLSVPVFVKTLGIGAIVAFVFGGVILIQTRDSLSLSLAELLKQHTTFEAESLAANLARPVATHDVVAIRQMLAKTREILSDVHYIIVRGRDGVITSHTFDGPVPADLVPMPTYRSFANERFRVVDSGPDGLIFEAMRPIVNGYAGYVQIGIGEYLIRREVAGLTTSIIHGLIISVGIGAGFAFFLTFVLTRPVQHLKEATERVRHGDFEARAIVYSGDEIGDLAVAFNEMAGSLQHYREEVLEDERIRSALIERIVSSHEEERKLISRELHDHFGQSLLAVLVGIRSRRSSGEPSCSTCQCQKLEAGIKDLIDELGRIVRGMRPTILDDYGLDSALESYVKETAADFHLDIAYKCNFLDGQNRLPAHMEVTLFRIAQEAITNVLRHAEANHVSVLLLQSPQEVTLLVEDDGKGFDQGRMQGDRGLGLMGMRERVALVGGVLDVGSELGEGTTIRARIPNRENASPCR